MELNREFGGYCMGTVVRFVGSFKTNGSSAPDTIRDGHSTCIKSVVRASAGLYTVTFDDGFPIPELPVFSSAHLHSSATPTVIAQANIVQGSYSQSTRSFQVVVYHTSGTPGVGDPDTGDRVNFEIVGSISSSGTDLA